MFVVKLQQPMVGILPENSIGEQRWDPVCVLVTWCLLRTGVGNLEKWDFKSVRVSLAWRRTGSDSSMLMTVECSSWLL